MSEGAIGVIGGSGLYELEGLTDIRWRRVRTPFGSSRWSLSRRAASSIVIMTGIPHSRPM